MRTSRPRLLGQLASAVQRLRQAHCPALHHAACEGDLEIGMPAGMAAIAERDAVAGFVAPTQIPRHEMMDVQLGTARGPAAVSTRVRITGQNYLADLLPSSLLLR